MKNVEQEVKSWIEKKIIYIAFIAIFLLGIAVIKTANTSL